MSDDKPIERSAHQKPKKKFSADVVVQKPKKSVDPRFDPMYGSFNKQHFEQHYKFLEERREGEHVQHMRRIRQLNAIIRRHALEEAGEDIADYDLSETEREMFCDGIPEDDSEAQRQAMRECSRLKKLPINMIEEEKERLQREVTVFKSQQGEKKTMKRINEVKKETMKKELKAVKEGEKKNPYFLKRGELKKKVAESTFEHLEGRGGKLLVDKYIERKRKR